MNTSNDWRKKLADTELWAAKMKFEKEHPANYEFIQKMCFLECYLGAREQTDKIQALLDKIDINLLDWNGNTLLAEAAIWGRQHTAKMLLHAEADPYMKSTNENSFSFRDIVERNNDIKNLYEEFKKEKLIETYIEKLKDNTGMPEEFAELITQYIV